MRGFVRAGAVLALAGMAFSGVNGVAHADKPSEPSGNGSDQRATGRFDLPLDGFSPANTRLTEGNPRAAGLADTTTIDAAWEQVEAYANPEDAGTRPMYASAVGLMAHHGQIIGTHASGFSRLYADGDGAKLPVGEQIAATEETIYDLASVTKLFTSLLIMQQVEQGTIDLDQPYAAYVPEFANNGKEGITLRQMLTHTSGLKPWLPLWSAYETKDERIQAVMETTPANEPGAAYTYSDLNLIALGVLVEKVTGQPLDRALETGITGPLELADTEFNPPESKLQRIAATEYQAAAGRGMVWGEVHDENAWSLGGVAGHAGVFSTAGDMAVLAQTLLNGGIYEGERILEQSTVEFLLDNQNEEFPGNAHGLGFELDQMWYMGGLANESAAGHTGYTGTSLVIDYTSRSFAILLTNRVHPSRAWGSNNPARRTVADGLAGALAVLPQKGPTAWSGGADNNSDNTLQTSVTAGEDTELSFDVFADNEQTDIFALETSVDGGETWTLVPYSVRSKQEGETVQTDGIYNNRGERTWGEAVAQLPAGEQLIRWRYSTDANTLGRGVFVDDIRVEDGKQTILNGEQDADAFVATGFSEVRR
ncbi:serine hydrolase domain-containing protein [Arthrobacter sp. H5]|uniref:serine hydrolase domain-containing protein n=1 Tax=Arthrobacter sp. H5 TaxID=1267973 RepID=UPI0004B9FFD6|nr:serine hydrolase domain-containing protein [Arthrobacter sp. H5]